MTAGVITFLTAALPVLVIIGLIAFGLEYFWLKQMARTQTKCGCNGRWNAAARFPTSARSNVIMLWGVDIEDMNRAELIETCHFMLNHPHPPCTPKSK